MITMRATRITEFWNMMLPLQTIYLLTCSYTLLNISFSLQKQSRQEVFKVGEKLEKTRSYVQISLKSPLRNLSLLDPKWHGFPRQPFSFLNKEFPQSHLQIQHIITLELSHLNFFFFHCRPYIFPECIYPILLIVQTA